MDITDAVEKHQYRYNSPVSIFHHSYPASSTQEIVFYNSDSIQDALRFFINKSEPATFREVELEWWFGSIIDIRGDVFYAQLEDLKGTRSIVEFSMDALAPEDISLVEKGAKLTYSVFRQDLRAGRTYGSRLAIARKAPWSMSDEGRARKLIEEYFPDSLLE